MSWLTDHLSWWVAGFIIAVGLFIFGRRDIWRFSLIRTWAISGVCFDESIRKKVLLITPLAIIGVIGVTQFQRALDEQDAIRQSIKVCLFATGLVVVMTSLILACTNLPKEIENRVIFTIVTKPVTRLEVVLGKVIGFARVSLAIVLIMGLFTWVYMRISEHQKENQIAARLNEGDVSDTERNLLNEYQRSGLLAARSMAIPTNLDLYGRFPQPGSDVRAFSNDGDEDMLVEYPIDRQELFGPVRSSDAETVQQGIGHFGMVIRIVLNTERTGPAKDQPPQTSMIGPMLNPATEPSNLLPPRLVIELLDDDRFSLVAVQDMVGAPTAADLAVQIRNYLATMKVNPDHNAGGTRVSPPTTLSDGTTGQAFYVWVPPNKAVNLYNHQRFFVRIAGHSANVDYLVGTKPVNLLIPQFDAHGPHLDAPEAKEIAWLPDPETKGQKLAFRGRIGLHLDQEMPGGDKAKAVASYTFHNASQAALANGNIPFELRAEVDRSTSTVEAGREDPTSLEIQVLDLATKKVTPLKDNVFIESREPTFFSIPANSVSGDDFQLFLRCRNSGHTVGLYPNSVRLITGSEGFELNLMKSLSILWLMSVLVIALSVLSSTFLSWPIAIVLTVLLLLGHWGVDQLSDSIGPGLGRQIVNDFKFSDVALSHVVSTGVDSLTRGLNVVAKVLPDTSQFDAIEEIEQGLNISMQTLEAALGVVLVFGIPATVLAYLVLRQKEVAP